MIHITDTPFGKYTHFMSNCLFHPTDAVEDPWGKAILDTLADDGGIKTVRIYNMLEDIVYTDSEGNLKYDFRLNDLRLDYLSEKGFKVLIAYASMPECISRTEGLGVSVSKGKTRYKGKLYNSSAPITSELWGEVCLEYTKHIVERYGIETVSGWRLQCFNEPDLNLFFLSDLPSDGESLKIRLREYCKMYESFALGVKSISPRLSVGGPALAESLEFLEGFLGYVKEHSLPLDYIALHCYGTHPEQINSGEKPVRVSNILERHREYRSVIEKCGFSDVPMMYDEWGAASHGFYNVEECPDLMFREDERYSAFLVRMMCELIQEKAVIDGMMICLSGQHEMTKDFSGFRNFLTLHGIKKPIYNAHCLAAMLGEKLVEVKCSDPNMFAVATKKDGEYVVLGTYCTDALEGNLPPIDETLTFDADVKGKQAVIYRIDRGNTNPYRLFQTMGLDDPDREQLRLLRREGELTPKEEFVCEENEIKLPMTANGVFLCRVFD